MTKFETYKLAIDKVCDLMKQRFMDILLGGQGTVFGDERGALTAVMEAALQRFLEVSEPYDLDLAQKLFAELKAKDVASPQDFHAVGCAIVGPND